MRLLADHPLQTLCLRQNLLKSIVTISVNLNPTLLTSLDLYDNLLTDLTGLEQLINLEWVLMPLITDCRHLDVSYNRLRTIDHLHTMTRLRALYMVHNKIRTIDNLDNNTALTLLELGDNRIRKIEHVNHLVNLKAMYLGESSRLPTK